MNLRTGESPAGWRRDVRLTVHASIGLIAGNCNVIRHLSLGPRKSVRNAREFQVLHGRLPQRRRSSRCQSTRLAATTRYARFRQCAVRSTLGACMIMGGHVENGLAKNRPDDILCSEASPLRAGPCHRSSPLNGGRCHVWPRTAYRLAVLGKQVIWKNWQKRQTEIFLPGLAGLSMQARDDSMGYTRQRGGAPWG